MTVLYPSAKRQNYSLDDVLLTVHKLWWLSQVLQDTLPKLLQQARPELVLYNAGVDVHKDDALGKLALTNDGIAARDRLVFAACTEYGAPVACAIGGGYQKDHQHIVERHVLLHRAAAEFMPAFAAMMDTKRAAAAARAAQRRRQHASVQAVVS
eukprot:GHUV01045707.1.p1 GENE.GHUV01045707.1~~GHUV01045707.1.p1  ORF type:complete len:154 (+),score=19.22 GHUV01045707.1:395-856(+)